MRKNIHTSGFFLFFCLFFFLCNWSQKSFSQVLTYSTPGITAWTCPAGVTSIRVESWGAGGAGGGVTTNNQAGGGGGGGAYNIANAIAVIPGNVYNITVGSGGAASTGNGGNGGSSFFNISTCIAAGGTGGGGNTTNGTGGTGGTGGFADGGNGATGAGSNYSGGGGGGAGTINSGSAATTTTGGAGGTIGGGNSGSGSTSNNFSGLAGGAPGGGGSGANKKGGAALSFNGGAGGNGQVRITYVRAALCGTYHIGSLQPAPFNTLTNAIATLNVSGVSCNVTFLLDDALYSVSETFPLSIENYAGNGPAGTLTGPKTLA